VGGTEQRARAEYLAPYCRANHFTGPTLGHID
jgi:hypothetical protein